MSKQSIGSPCQEQSKDPKCAGSSTASSVTETTSTAQAPAPSDPSARTDSHARMSTAEKLSMFAAIACALAVMVLEALGLSGTIRYELANLIALPLLGTAALLGGIQSFHRSQKIRSVFASAAFNFITAAILYACSIFTLVVYLLTA